ncbi:GNAT family N-acetyltransferase [Candidatus Woesearchaeota archaeon]|nr:GNAT family N-acetyltransferase [Candidatus Woesearchaeota archaeon]
MDRINFVTSTSRTLDDKLLGDVYSVVAPSMRSNSGYYDPSSIEVALQAYEPHRFREWSQPLLLSIFAYDGEKMVGTGFLKHRKFENVTTEAGGYLFGGFILPEYQRQGIGRKIIETQIDHAKRIGIKVLRGNASEASLKLLQDLGFVEIGKHEDDALKSKDGAKAELHTVELKLQ